MVPYDVPHVAHDMILRFMHVNFSALADGSARIPSSVGADAKPHFVTLGEAEGGEGEGKPGKTEEQHTAMEEGVCLIYSLMRMFLLSRMKKGK